MTPPHGSDHPATWGSRFVFVGILSNLSLALIKSVAAVYGGSSALLADALESIFDIVSSLVVWGGLRLAAKPPDENHPYGHGKAEPLATVAASISLVVAALVVTYHSLSQLFIPHPPPAAFTLGVLVFVILFKEILFRRVFSAGSLIDSTALEAEAWHHRSDAMTSGAAFLGISVAILGGNGWEIADELAALFAAGVILYNAIRLVRPALAELTDAAPNTDVAGRIRQIAAAVPGVIDIEKCLVRKMGFDYYVDIHIEVDGSLSVFDGHEIAHRVKDAIREKELKVREVLTHIEPKRTSEV